MSITYLKVRGHVSRVAECARCEMVRPLVCRGLCNPCRMHAVYDGTIGDYGYVKADRLRDFAGLREARYPVPVAAARLGVSVRTGWRYEAELRVAVSRWTDESEAA